MFGISIRLSGRGVTSISSWFFVWSYVLLPSKACELLKGAITSIAAYTPSIFVLMSALFAMSLSSFSSHEFSIQQSKIYCTSTLVLQRSWNLDFFKSFSSRWCFSEPEVRQLNLLNRSIFFCFWNLLSSSSRVNRSRALTRQFSLIIDSTSRCS